MTRYVPIHKPVSVKKLRVRPKAMSAKRRKEAALVAKVFQEIEPRDGHCRLNMHGLRGGYYDGLRALIGPCEGPSQPAHLPAWRRSKATGIHSRVSIVRLCARHHSALDRHLFDLDYNPTMGADGYLVPVPHCPKGAV